MNRPPIVTLDPAQMSDHATIETCVPPGPSSARKPKPAVVIIDVDRGGVGCDNSPCRAASPLAPLPEDGLDVQDRGAVDRFEIADRDGVFLDRLDRDGVQADRVRAVGRAGREHAR